MRGQQLNAELATRVADRLLRDAEPLEHNGYKVPTARALIQRALRQLS